MVKNFYAVVNDKNQFLKESITDDNSIMLFQRIFIIT